MRQLIGSSPRVRGTRPKTCPCHARIRFIPACAGNSGHRAGACRRAAVHPRVCGELPTSVAGTGAATGSSPRVRGTPGAGPRCRCLCRFIPACAGNSLVALCREAGVDGSSPRVRGTRLQLLPRLGDRRFIPACAGNSWAARCSADSRSVHPRVCGELACRAASPACSAGSSPRVRGTRRETPSARQTRRFIPACAGNSRWPASAPRRASVHPRVCGELSVICWLVERSAGSSPRVRGTPGAAGAPVPVRRFIPACAGNSPACSARCARSAVHPRVCGELGNVYYQSYSKDGSSPRVRGTLCRYRQRAHLHRFIPACAGNSLRRVRRPHLHHGSSPRVRGTRHAVERGEQLHRFIPACAGNSKEDLSAQTTNNGSSPRVRGTRTALGVQQRACRFIPACAGNSEFGPTSWTGTPVHPRVCGELCKGRPSRHRAFGSSPRVRGTRRRAPLAVALARFIPACAGNSAIQCRVTSQTTVHPRVCGELVEADAYLVDDSGSSPRVRGTPARRRCVHAHWRFIPACAGNSVDASINVVTQTVHPRVCGELSRVNVARISFTGSSPRVRGTLGRVLGCSRSNRFIPACAGNSPTLSAIGGLLAVHPRVCGELDAMVLRLRFPAGSSPRVRGTRTQGAPAHAADRFIPACAGNSSRCMPRLLQ